MVHSAFVERFGPTTLVLAVGFAILAALERMLPLRRARRSRAGRWLTNAGVTALGLTSAALLVQPAMQWAASRAPAIGFGVLSTVEWPAWAEGAVAFLLLDVTFYYWHRLLHATPWLWRFHAVHHADPDLDISTSYRFHFVEVGLSSGFRALQVLCIGASVSQLAAYALIYQIASMFHHGNIGLPAWLDRALSVLVITPRLHGIHHSQQRAHANSNYAVVLSVWDWIHGTRIATADQASLRIGVAGVDGPLDNGLLRALFAPFRRQPSYWRETLPRS